MKPNYVASELNRSNYESEEESGLDWITEYTNALKWAGKSDNTISNFSSDIIEFLTWFDNTYGKTFDGKVLEQDAKEYRNYLLNIRRQKPTTINRKLAALKSFNQFLIQEGSSLDVPICGISLADTADINIKTVEKNELNRLKRCVYAKGNKRDIAIIELLINTGVRVSELISLTLGDLHLTDRNGSQNYSYIVIRCGKGGKYREIPLNTQAKKALEENLSVRASNSDKVFLGQRGPLRRESIDKIIKKYCHEAGIQDISCHTLRHTFCTRLVQENTPLPVVSKLAGHTNLQTTMRFYVNVSRQDKANAVNKL